MTLSNRPKLKPRPPDGIEAAFRAALREGCPHCGSRRVVGQYRGGVWDFGLRCEAGCATFTDPRLAHRVGAEAAARAGAAAGQELAYRAVDSCSAVVSGVVLAAGAKIHDKEG